MARWQEAADLIRQGYSPASVADRMHVSINTVLPYLFLAIGSGKLSRTQVIFTISRDLRSATEESVTELGPRAAEQDIISETRSRAPDATHADVYAYLQLRGGSDAGIVALSDMYRTVADLEMALHWIIREGLTFIYGKNWWRDGVPESVRKDCRLAQEGDPEAIEDPFCYTNFIHLKQILDKNWGDFQRVVPSPLASDKGGLLSRLTRLNQVRNQIMHPVKQRLPTEDDFAFVQESFNFLSLLEWRVFKTLK